MQNDINQINHDIAARIRELRELKELTAAQMASSLSLSEEKYALLESGTDDISASMLNHIAQLLNVDLALLLTGKESRMNTFTVTRAGKGVSVERRKQYQYQSLAANFTGKHGEPFLVTCPARGEDAAVSLNTHPGQEMDYILEGTLKVVICGNEIVLQPGDTIFFDSSHPHGMAALGTSPAKFIAIIM